MSWNGTENKTYGSLVLLSLSLLARRLPATANRKHAGCDNGLPRMEDEPIREGVGGPDFDVVRPSGALDDDGAREQADLDLVVAICLMHVHRRR